MAALYLAEKSARQSSAPLTLTYSFTVGAPAATNDCYYYYYYFFYYLPTTTTGNDSTTGKSLLVILNPE